MGIRSIAPPAASIASPKKVPVAVVISGERLYVACGNDNRVVGYERMPTADARPTIDARAVSSVTAAMSPGRTRPRACTGLFVCPSAALGA